MNSSAPLTQRYSLPERNGDHAATTAAQPANRRFTCHPQPGSSASPDPSGIAPSESAIQTPSSNIQRPESSPRAFKPKARNGKIARLPKLERDMVNLMLQNNIEHSKIVDALDEHGIHVTERNISNWKTRGGYKEWVAEQNHAVSLRLHQDNLTEYLREHDATELPEVGLQLAATQLSEFFLDPRSRQQLATEPQSYARAVGTLCRLARQIHTLQKYRDEAAKTLGSEHNPERLKRHREHSLEVTRDVYSSFIPDTAPIDPEIPHRNYLPKNPLPVPADELDHEAIQERHNLLLQNLGLGPKPSK